eukprot:86082_1
MSQYSQSSSSSALNWNKFDTVKSYCTNNKLMQTCSKTGHRRKVLCLEWSVDGKYLASGSADNMTYVYKLDSEKSLKDPIAQFNLDGQKSSITSLDWNPKVPSVLCSASDDAHVYLWDINKFESDSKLNKLNKNDSADSASNGPKSCKPYHIIKTGNPLNGISWSHDGTKICISDRENTITLVDGHKYTELKKYKAPSSTKIHSFKWTNDDKYIVITTKDGYVRIFNANTLHKVHEFQAHAGSCFCIDISSDNQYIATGGADSMITIIDMNTLIQKYGLIPFETSVNCLSFNFNNKLIASSSDDHFINISYIDKDRVNSCCKITTKSSINALKWHPTKHMLAYCGCPDISTGDHINLNNKSSPSSSSVNIWGALKKY